MPAPSRSQAEARPLLRPVAVSLLRSSSAGNEVGAKGSRSTKELRERERDQAPQTKRLARFSTLVL